MHPVRGAGFARYGFVGLRTLPHAKDVALSEGREVPRDGKLFGVSSVSSAPTPAYLLEENLSGNALPRASESEVRRSFELRHVIQLRAPQSETSSTTESFHQNSGKSE